MASAEQVESSGVVEAPSAWGLSLPKRELLPMLAAVERVASRDASRPALCSVHFEGDGERVRLVATDGHRLQVACVAQDMGLRTPFAFTLPRASLARIRGQAKTVRAHARVSIALHDDRVLVQSGSSDACELPRIDGEYPAWRMVLPREGETLRTASIFPGFLLRHLDRFAALWRVSESERLYLAIQSESADAVMLRCGSGDGFSAQASLPWEAHPFAEPTGFAPGYLADAVRYVSEKCPNEPVKVHIRDAKSPLYLGDIDDRLAVVMPARL